MSISINTSFIPYKLDLHEKKPVRMDIEVINRYAAQKKVLIEVNAGPQIGFNKTSTQKEKYELGLMKPGESKAIKLDVVPKNFALRGEQPIEVIATEITVEESGYAYPSKKFRKTTSIQLK